MMWYDLMLVYLVHERALAADCTITTTNDQLESMQKHDERAGPLVGLQSEAVASVGPRAIMAIFVGDAVLRVSHSDRLWT